MTERGQFYMFWVSFWILLWNGMGGPAWAIIGLIILGVGIVGTRAVLGSLSGRGEVSDAR